MRRRRRRTGWSGCVGRAEEEEEEDKSRGVNGILPRAINGNNQVASHVMLLDNRRVDRGELEIGEIGMGGREEGEIRKMGEKWDFREMFGRI